MISIPNIPLTPSHPPINHPPPTHPPHCPLHPQVTAQGALVFQRAGLKRKYACPDERRERVDSYRPHPPTEMQQTVWRNHISGNRGCSSSGGRGALTRIIRSTEQHGTIVCFYQILPCYRFLCFYVISSYTGTATTTTTTNTASHRGVKWVSILYYLILILPPLLSLLPLLFPQRSTGLGSVNCWPSMRVQLLAQTARVAQVTDPPLSPSLIYVPSNSITNN